MERQSNLNIFTEIKLYHEVRWGYDCKDLTQTQDFKDIPIQFNINWDWPSFPFYAGTILDFVFRKWWFFSL